MQNKGNLYKVKDVLLNEDKIPLNEYPRPTLVRDNWINLNGEWDFTISKVNKIPSSFDKKIIVPYAVESILSHINVLVEPDDYLIYQKKITLPSTMKEKTILLHFNGIDQIADVYLDRRLVKSHEGIMNFVVSFPYQKEITITVIVNDKSDLSYLARGKQTLEPNAYLYSSSSGIIKTVWLEAVNKTYIEDIKFYPDYDKKSVGVFVKANSNQTAKIKINNEQHEIKLNKINKIKLKDFHPWSNVDPYLYDVEVILANDKVKSYFGVRKISIQEINCIKRILLNNQPILLSGVLNQGYYFLGDLTPKSYEDYLFDIKAMKELGFNLLRVHAKVEEEVFYYYCDKLGMLLSQDFVNGGNRYDKKMIYLPRLHRKWDYHHLTLEGAGRVSKESQDSFKKEVDYYLDHFNNYPSVLIYTIFNEAWGEFNPNYYYEYCKRHDSLHLFDTASGWMDAKSDFYSVHTYSFPKMKRPDKLHRAVIFTEVGGIGFKVNEHSYFDGYFAHKICNTNEKYKKKVSDLYLNAMKYQITKQGINAIVYTQLADCETEYNGLYTFDRKVLKLDKELIKNLNEKTYQTFNDQIKK
ncbi:MAG: hypothetical protein MJ213_04950 [Bacilli bacterium]|nr:hypothetical protein [Bacilli bacterium]